MRKYPTHTVWHDVLAIKLCIAAGLLLYYFVPPHLSGHVALATNLIWLFKE